MNTDEYNDVILDMDFEHRNTHNTAKIRVSIIDDITRDFLLKKEDIYREIMVNIIKIKISEKLTEGWELLDNKTITIGKTDIAIARRMK